MKTITHKSGATEKVADDNELASKDKYKEKKKASDLSGSDVKELVYEMAKLHNLI